MKNVPRSSAISPTENQRLVLEKVAGHRGWEIVQAYEDAGISGAKGREQRPAFDAMLRDAVRRRYDILMVWSGWAEASSIWRILWPNSTLPAFTARGEIAGRR